MNLALNFCSDNFHIPITSCFAGVRELLKKCIIVRGEDPMSVQANENATMLFQSLVRETFCTKLVAEKHKLTEEVSHGRRCIYR